jgi:hypothetical protein
VHIEIGPDGGVDNGLTKWPNSPIVEKDDPQEKMKEILYQAQVAVISAVHQAELDAEKAKADHARERANAEWEAEHALNQAVHDAFLEVGKGAIERSRAAAEFVQKAAVAIASLYTGILALSFTATTVVTTGDASSIAAPFAALRDCPYRPTGFGRRTVHCVPLVHHQAAANPRAGGKVRVARVSD